MPIAESSDKVTARSTLRHRPIGDDADQQGQRSSGTDDIIPIAQRASRLHPKQTEEDQPGHIPATPRLSGGGLTRKARWRGHPLLYLGFGMIAMLALWTL